MVLNIFLIGDISVVQRSKFKKSQMRVLGLYLCKRFIFQKAETDPKELQRIVLAVDVLGEFYFSRGALQRIMQYVADVRSKVFSIFL